MATIARIVRGQGTYTSSDTSGDTWAPGGATWDTARTVIMFSYKANISVMRGNRHMAWCTFDGTTVTIKVDATPSGSETLVWNVTLIEFDTGALQNCFVGTHAMTAAVDTDTLGTTLSNIANAFVTTQIKTDLEANTAVPSVKTLLTNTTTITFSGNGPAGANDQNINYQVVEFKSADITNSLQGTITFSGTLDNDPDNTAALGFTADTAKTVAMCQGGYYTSGAYTGEGQLGYDVDLSDASNVRGHRAKRGSASSNSELAYNVIEFATGVTTKTGTLTLTDATDTSKSVGASWTLNANRAFALHDLTPSNICNGENNDSLGGPSSNTLQCVETIDGTPNLTDITISRVSTGGTVNYRYDVIEFPAAGGGLSIPVAMHQYARLRA